MSAPVRRMSQAETHRRVKHADFLYTAAFTARCYGRPDLARELTSLAQGVRDGVADFGAGR